MLLTHGPCLIFETKFTSPTTMYELFSCEFPVLGAFEEMQDNATVNHQDLVSENPGLVHDHDRHGVALWPDADAY
jgi:hypothetical protein